jgi:hypothetical protein
MYSSADMSIFPKSSSVTPWLMFLANRFVSSGKNRARGDGGVIYHGITLLRFLLVTINQQNEKARDIMQVQGFWAARSDKQQCLRDFAV